MAFNSRLVNEETINGTRTIGHLDVDAFEWQVVSRDNPDYLRRPGIVINHMNRILAVSYEARAFGITRKMSPDEAENKCPDLIIHTKEMEYRKPASRMVRLCSQEIKDAIMGFINSQNLDIVVNYASTDEFFFDLTKEVNRRILQGRVNILSEIKDLPRSPILYLESTKEKQAGREAILSRISRLHRGPAAAASPDRKQYEDEVRLLHGGMVMSKIIRAIKEARGFICSGGVGQNVLLAKLACGLNKPNGLTLLPLASLTRISKKILVEQIPGIGDDGANSFGVKLRGMGIRTMFQLQNTSMRTLNRVFKAENCHRLIALGHGISHDTVEQRDAKSSLTCGKESARLHSLQDLVTWFGMDALGGEMCERLAEEGFYNGRRATKVCIEIRLAGAGGRKGRSNLENSANLLGATIRLNGSESDCVFLELIRQMVEAEAIKCGHGRGLQFPCTAALKLWIPDFVPLRSSRF